MTGALLTAAGLSTRMGRFKPLLPLGDDTLLRRGVKTLLTAGCGPVAVVTGHQAELIERHLSDLPVTCLFNPDYARCEMLDSVRLGLRWMEGRCERLLFAPGDAPLFGLDAVQALMRVEDPLCYPVYEGRRGHPVLIGGELIPAILGYDGPGGLAGALAQFSGAELPVATPGVLMDADTPADYERMLAWDEGGGRL